MAANPFNSPNPADSPAATPPAVADSVTVDAVNVPLTNDANFLTASTLNNAGIACDAMANPKMVNNIFDGQREVMRVSFGQFIIQ